VKILIVYEYVPESTKYYSVEVAANEWEWMRQTHGHFVNCTTDKAALAACNQLSTWLEGHQPFEAKERTCSASRRRVRVPTTHRLPAVS
jgi:hypothetical protein